VLPRVYHLLTESEPFAEHDGGAISRWAAHVLRHDEDAVVLAPWADDSWGFPENRVQPIPQLLHYKRLQDFTRQKLPWGVRKHLLKSILVSATRVVGSGDVLWVHNRPEFAAVLSHSIQKQGGRLVLHMHNSHLRESDHLRQDLAPDHFVFVSKFLQTEAQSILGHLPNSTVLYNGASAEVFYPKQNPDAQKESVPMILLASRLVPEKGVHIFVAAMRRLLERGVQAVGSVVGSSGFGGSKLTGYLRDLRKQAPPNVTFHEYCVGRALGEKFRQADIFCLPSTWHDPFPLVVLEAMACGLPIVTTNSGGIPEMLTDGGGVLVSRDAVGECAEALEELICNVPLRRRMGSEAYSSFLKNYTWPAVYANYRNILRAMPS
jgi:spore coat protein SA